MVWGRLNTTVPILEIRIALELLANRLFISKQGTARTDRRNRLREESSALVMKRPRRLMMNNSSSFLPSFSCLYGHLLYLPDNSFPFVVQTQP